MFDVCMKIFESKHKWIYILWAIEYKRIRQRGTINFTTSNFILKDQQLSLVS